MNVRAWLSAFRLRTLPLTLASILMGSFLAADALRWSVFGLACLTTVLLQILSNVANDYGDSVHGADHALRQGPQRAVQAGLISKSAMKKAIILFAVLALLSGGALLWVSVGTSWKLLAGFLGLGLLAIFAAITYTAGAKPYGYAGLGDIAVLIFFGWLGVVGTYFLHTLHLNWAIFLPATACGCFATAVLNINNIRDIESDSLAGKKSIPVRLGREKAVIYHFLLLTIGMVCAFAYVFIFYRTWSQFSFVITLPLFFINAKAVSTQKDAKLLDPFLKQMALTSLLFSVLFGLGQWLN